MSQLLLPHRGPRRLHSEVLTSLLSCSYSFKRRSLLLLALLSAFPTFSSCLPPAILRHAPPSILLSVTYLPCCFVPYPTTTPLRSLPYSIPLARDFLLVLVFVSSLFRPACLFTFSPPPPFFSSLFLFFSFRCSLLSVEPRQNLRDRTSFSTLMCFRLQPPFLSFTFARDSDAVLFFVCLFVTADVTCMSCALILLPSSPFASSSSASSFFSLFSFFFSFPPSIVVFVCVFVFFLVRTGFLLVDVFSQRCRLESRTHLSRCWTVCLCLVV